MSVYPFVFKAAILEKNNKPLVIDSIEFPGPLLAGQVLVKLSYSGICGKQIEEIDGTDGSDPWLPHLLGHEGSGEVIDVGPAVIKVKKTDTVVLHWMKGSGIHSSTPLYFRKGSRINAGWVTTFNEFAVVSENRVTPIPKGSDLLVSALLGCAATTGVGVVINEAQVQPYDTVVVYGCGGIGLCAVQAARLRYPRKIIAVDINKDSLVLARQFGATDLINASEENVLEYVRKLTSGCGATKVIIATGNPEAIELAVETAGIPAQVFFVGVPPKGSKVKLDAHAIMHKRCINGTLGGGIWPDRDIPTYLSMHKEGQLHLDKVVSRIVPFAEINEVIKQKRAAIAGRCVIKF
ncbi:MAG: zinc-binding dehydrogenase [Candidatus Omnitrophica bacterium]|nr:zinc-binding dehydrogenase [Candidatus Omnitrophota bacterium]